LHRIENQYVRVDGTPPNRPEDDPTLADFTDDGQTEVSGRIKLGAAVLERLVELRLFGPSEDHIREAEDHIREAAAAWRRRRGGGGADAAGVREPRRPLPTAGAGDIAVPIERFVMSVESCVTITGSGTIIAGEVWAGVVHAGDALVLIRDGVPWRTTCLDVDMVNFTRDQLDIPGSSPILLIVSDIKGLEPSEGDLIIRRADLAN